MIIISGGWRSLSFSINYFSCAWIWAINGITHMHMNLFLHCNVWHDKNLVCDTNLCDWCLTYKLIRITKLVHEHVAFFMVSVLVSWLFCIVWLVSWYNFSKFHDYPTHTLFKNIIRSLRLVNTLDVTDMTCSIIQSLFVQCGCKSYETQ